MKTKAQKTEELKKAAEMLKKSDVLLFTDFGKVSAEDLRKLRREVSGIGGSMLVIKKRLLNVLLKEKGFDYDVRQFGAAVGTVFASGGVETASGPVYKFFAALGGTDKEAKAAAIKKVLGGYDLKAKAPIDAATVVMIGQLPPREVLLGQLLGQLLAPLQSLMYLMNEKSKRSSA